MTTLNKTQATVDALFEENKNVRGKDDTVYCISIHALALGYNVRNVTPNEKLHGKDAICATLEVKYNNLTHKIRVFIQRATDGNCFRISKIDTVGHELCVYDKTLQETIDILKFYRDVSRNIEAAYAELESI